MWSRTVKLNLVVALATYPIALLLSCLIGREIPMWLYYLISCVIANITWRYAWSDTQELQNVSTSMRPIDSKGTKEIVATYTDIGGVWKSLWRGE